MYSKLLVNRCISSTILLLVIMTRDLHCMQDQDNHETRLVAGRTQYEVLSREASRPRYGPCWRAALSSLEHGCKNLDDEIQSRLALNFANCFLEKSGQRSYPCSELSEISSCLEDVDTNAFTAYSNFFTHTQNMCYFLQSQAWQEEADLTIQNLAANSAQVSESLAESHVLQESIVAGQQQSLEYQRQLLENGSHLSRAIELSKGNVKQMIEEFKLSTSEQKTLIFEVFDRVSRLQNLVVSEVSWLYTVVFYSACLLVIYLLTATRRTAEARLWLFVLLSLNLGVERMVVKLSLPQEGHEVVDLSQIVHNRVWMVRHTAIALGVLLLSFIAVKFKDYNKINNNLLEEIRRQNFELKRSMECFQVGSKTSSYPPPINTGIDTLDGHLSSLSQLLSEDTGFVGDEECFSDDSDSFNSTKTDITYNPGSRDNSFSDGEFGTAANSRDTTPVNDEIDSAMEALSSNLLSSFCAPSLPSLPCTPSKVELVAKKSSTPRNKRTSGLQVQREYNLRSRNKSGSSNSSSILQKEEITESAEDFGKLVKKQLGKTKRNVAKWKMAMKRNSRNGEYSSDES